MAYSRWSNSEWYAFWDAGSGGEKEYQLLSLWLRPSIYHLKWSYKILTYHRSNLTLLIKSYYGEVTNDVIKEAVGIIEEFMRDVESEFSEGEK